MRSSAEEKCEFCSGKKNAPCGVWAASVDSLCKPTLADHVNSVPDHRKWSIVPCVFHARSLCIQRSGPFGAGGRRTSFRHSPGILFSCDCEDTSSRSKAAQATAVRECQLGWVAPLPPRSRSCQLCGAAAASLPHASTEACGGAGARVLLLFL